MKNLIYFSLLFAFLFAGCDLASDPNGKGVNPPQPFLAFTVDGAQWQGESVGGQNASPNFAITASRGQGKAQQRITIIGYAWKAGEFHTGYYGGEWQGTRVSFSRNDSTYGAPYDSPGTFKITHADESSCEGTFSIDCIGVNGSKVTMRDGKFLVKY